MTEHTGAVVLPSWALAKLDATNRRGVSHMVIGLKLQYEAGEADER